MRVRELGHEDLEDIRAWRNAQLGILRQSDVITPARQERWWSTTYSVESRWPDPSQLLFVMTQDGGRVSYGGLTHISWLAMRAEISFLAATPLAADPVRYAQLEHDFVKFLLCFGFGELGMRRLYAETYAFRTAHVAMLEEVGFTREGCLREHGWADARTVDSFIHGCLATEVSPPELWIAIPK